MLAAYSCKKWDRSERALGEGDGRGVRPTDDALRLRRRPVRGDDPIAVVDRHRAGGEHRGDRAVLERRELHGTVDGGRGEIQALDDVDDVDPGEDHRVRLSLVRS